MNFPIFNHLKNDNLFQDKTKKDDQKLNEKLQNNNKIS